MTDTSLNAVLDAAQKLLDEIRLAIERKGAARPAVSVPVQPAEPERKKALLTVPEAAETLSISRATVFKLLKDGDLNSVTVGSRRLIPATEIDRFITDNRA